MSLESLGLNIKFNEQGLVPVILQDAANGDVLMQAYMNEEALTKTLETGKCTYYSRSRNKLWVKGEESGHRQDLQSIFIDCDNDCILIKINQEGGACHTGYRSCFFTAVEPKTLKTGVVGKKVFDPDKVYKKGS